VSKQNIHIERVEIRLRGVSAEAARASTAGLGHALLAELVGRTRAAPQTGGDADEGVGPATSRREEQGGAPELQLSIARKVAASVRERLK
jgi:hypothetical protein